MSKDRDTGVVHLVRRGARAREQRGEQVVLLERDEGILRLVQAVLPIGGVKYVVPSGRLGAPIDFDGSILELHVEETDESLEVYPSVRIVGLAKGGSAKDHGRTLAAVLHDHSDYQLPRIREITDAVFAEHLGLRTSAARLDGIADDKGQDAYELIEEVRRRCGLEIEWRLDPAPKVSGWIRKLQSLIAEGITQRFNEESRTAQFNLTYSARIDSVLPSWWHVVQRRAASGTTPEEECKRILKRTFVKLNPGFGAFGDGTTKVWLHRNFWLLVESAFSDHVVPTIREEFGYNMTFADFRRERTEAERETLALLESPERLKHDFEEAEAYYHQLKLKEREAIEDNDFDLESEHVLRIQSVVKHARGEMEAAKTGMENGSRGGATAISAEESAAGMQVMRAFHDALHLERQDLLRIEGASSGDASVKDEGDGASGSADDPAEGSAGEG